MHNYYNMRGIGILAALLLCAANMRAAADFVISRGGVSAPVVADSADWKGVHIAAANLANDIGKVSGTPAGVRHTLLPGGGQIVAGTVGRSPAIDALVSSGRLDVDEIRGQWEAYVIDTVDGNLVVAGSDKRGTIYGIYEISRRIGVSPWHFWADVLPARRDEIVFPAGRSVQPSPKVKYRGIFINDEWPSFGGWAGNRFGGINSRMYATMFELLLRLKANYLWPAMWDSRFNEDDPECPRVADDYGIVMGTSHHEPMMRAHKEYVYRKDSIGTWDYATNKERIDRFFREGMARNKDYENLVTIGMRGDGDVAMGRGDDEENIRVLHDVIDGQRRIIADTYGAPDGVPQLWAVFTEVQRYYDAGFTVPDDVTVLLCDNNWGYIRRMAPPGSRKGGYGLYYHIDMNGGPWNDRWVNTSPLPKLREQLHLAYASGIDHIWIINVGDLKPKELPIDFIMSYAWDPDATAPGDEAAFLTDWAASVFGSEQAPEIADVLARYPKYNLWRKAEVQLPGIFSPENYGEIDRVDSLWLDVERKAERLRAGVRPELDDAYYQLVYYPAVASSTVARLYNAVTRNHYYADRGDARANAWADEAKALFARDSVLTDYYNRTMAGGKWNGMMQDKHIGYSQWFMPDSNILPELRYVDAATASAAHAAPRRQSTELGIDAVRFSRNIPRGGAAWTLLPDLGRGEGCMGIGDVLAASAEPGLGPVLEYDITLAEGADSLRVALGILPTQDVRPARGLRIAVAVDGGEPVVVDARQGFVDTFAEYTPDNLKRSLVLKPLPAPARLSLGGFGRPMRNEVFDNMRWLDVCLPAVEAGEHTLRVFMVDPEIVLEKIVLNPDNSTYSYFGPTP